MEENQPQPTTVAEGAALDEQRAREAETVEATFPDNDQSVPAEPVVPAEAAVEDPEAGPLDDVEEDPKLPEDGEEPDEDDAAEPVTV
jgi:hypothetical protein